jgi:hypothetical protein
LLYGSSSKAPKLTLEPWMLTLEPRWLTPQAAESHTGSMGAHPWSLWGSPSNHGGSPWSNRDSLWSPGGSPKSCKGSSRAMVAHPWAEGAHPGAMETHSRAMDTYLRDMDSHPGTMDSHPGTMGGHPRAGETLPGAVEGAHHGPVKGLLSSHGGKPWSHGGSHRNLGTIEAHTTCSFNIKIIHFRLLQTHFLNEYSVSPKLHRRKWINSRLIIVIDMKKQLFEITTIIAIIMIIAINVIINNMKYFVIIVK